MSPDTASRVNSTTQRRATAFQPRNTRTTRRRMAHHRGSEPTETIVNYPLSIVNVTAADERRYTPMRMRETTRSAKGTKFIPNRQSQIVNNQCQGLSLLTYHLSLPAPPGRSSIVNSMGLRHLRAYELPIPPIQGNQPLPLRHTMSLRGAPRRAAISCPGNPKHETRNKLESVCVRPSAPFRPD